MIFPPNFPWKLYLKYSVIPFAGTFPLLWLGGVPTGKALAAYSLVGGVWLISARRLFMPLGRLLQATHQVSNDVADADLRDDSGEWSDLEAALTKIRVDLRGKTEALSKEREELSVLMSAISDAILAVDLTESVLFSNPRFETLFAPGGDRLGELFRSPEILELFRKTLLTGEPSSGEFQQNRYFSVVVTPLKSSLGETYGAVGVFHDVTELKMIERVRIDFVANVSHELRTPLTSLKGFSDTLTEDARAGRLEAVPEYAAVIGRNVERLMALVADLLDLSSLESGEELKTSHVDARLLTSRVLQQLNSKAQAKQLKIHVDYLSDALNADERRAEQVVVNLVDNAIKYVGQSGNIWITWRPGDRGVQLSIRDDGPGIPPASISRIFERFYRVDSGRSREVGGTGLGLSIVKHIMQRHGGSARVVSELGNGSEFLCEFPK